MTKLRILAVIVLATFAAPSFANHCCLDAKIAAKALQAVSDEKSDNSDFVSKHAAHHCSHAHSSDRCEALTFVMAVGDDSLSPVQKDDFRRLTIVGPLLEPPSLS